MELDNELKLKGPKVTKNQRSKMEELGVNNQGSGSLFLELATLATCNISSL
jgi:hypothetical protein